MNALVYVIVLTINGAAQPSTLQFSTLTDCRATAYQIVQDPRPFDSNNALFMSRNGTSQAYCRVAS